MSLSAGHRAKQAVRIFPDRLPGLAVLLGLLLSLNALADPRADYRMGIAAFQQQEFELALDHFNRAAQQGLQLVSLHYNLGSTHYRLGNYPESARHFAAIRDDAQWGALAEYNLGLIAEQRQQHRQALEHYRAAYERSDSPRVKAMARERLDALDDAPSPARRDWSLFLMLSPGYDDNPTLLDHRESGVSKEGDAFAELLVSARGYFFGDSTGGLRANVGYYGRHYNDLSEYSVSGVSTGLFYDTRAGHWNLSTGLRLGGFWVDGDRLSTDTSLILQARRSLGSWQWLLENDTTRVSAVSEFAYLEGLRNRVTTDLSGHNGLGRWRIGYRYEYNDREDLEFDDRFFSYSPLRHRFYGRWVKDLGGKWSSQVALVYRVSRYRDANVDWDPDDDEGYIVNTRKENRTDASLALNYAFSNTWRTFLEFRHTDNSANSRRYTYRSNQLALGIDAFF